MFRPRYGEGVLAQNKQTKLNDYLSLKNAVLLIDALKRDNIHRNVYLVRDSERTIEHCYRYMCSSYFNRFKNRIEMPPEKLPFHTSLKFTQYYPCSILKGRLYLGDANHATSWYVIKNMRITHIANITDVVPNSFDDDDEKDITYLQIEAEDRSHEQLIDYFP